MSISHVEGRLDQPVNQTLDTYEPGQSPAELEARYITATQRLQELCDFDDHDIDTRVSQSGNDLQIRTAPQYVQRYETAEIVTGRDGKPVKRPKPVDLYAQASRVLTGTPRLATSSDPGGIRPGEERYITDFDNPRKDSEYLSVTIFSQPRELTYERAREEVLDHLLPVFGMDSFKSDPKLWKYVQDILPRAKTDPSQSNADFMKVVEKEGIPEDILESLVEHLKSDSAPGRIRQRFEALEASMIGAISERVHKAIDVRQALPTYTNNKIKDDTLPVKEENADKTEAMIAAKSSRTYYPESTVSWSAKPPENLTAARVEEIERAVKYARGERVIPPEQPLAPAEKRSSEAEQGIGQVLGNMAVGIEGTNARLDQLTRMLMHVMNAAQIAQVQGGSDPKDKPGSVGFH